MKLVRSRWTGVEPTGMVGLYNLIKECLSRKYFIFNNNPKFFNTVDNSEFLWEYSLRASKILSSLASEYYVFLMTGDMALLLSHITNPIRANIPVRNTHINPRMLSIHLFRLSSILFISSLRLSIRLLSLSLTLSILWFNAFWPSSGRVIQSFVTTCQQFFTTINLTNILPGSGQLYAGDYENALYSFLLVGTGLHWLGIFTRKLISLR